MLRRTPIKRTPFQRSQPERAERPERIKPVAKPLERPVRYAEPANDEHVELPKPEAHRNRRLLDMARGQACLLRVPNTCNGDRTTTVAAHSNWGVDGKGGARKADDHHHVYACSACHYWLDFGSAPAEEKQARFKQAYAWMVAIWLDIVQGRHAASPKQRAAAQWALDRLKTTTNL